MAQLSDDCFAFGGKLLRLDAALDDLQQRIQPVISRERMSGAGRLGRILADDIVSPIAIPGFANSAVDGYAVRHADLTAGEDTALPIAMRIPAGALNIPALIPGVSARIFTGAPMPEGADTVFMQEDCRVEGKLVYLPPGLARGANRRHAGEDFAAGSLMIPVGTRLEAQHLAALAASGQKDVCVYKPLRVAVLSTGNELRDAGQLPSGAIYDSNRAMLLALLARRGMEGVDCGIIPDDPDHIAEALANAAAQADVVLTSGGVSTGEEDHVKAAVERAGRLDFWRLAIKPGRPVAMGRIGEASIFGLPGNPAAVFVTFLRFVGPVLDMLAGTTPRRPLPFQVEAGFSYAKKRDRREYLRVTLAAGRDGQLVAQRFPRDGAALISSLLAADALAELPEDVTVLKAGEKLAVYPFAQLV